MTRRQDVSLRKKRLEDMTGSGRKKILCRQGKSDEIKEGGGKGIGSYHSKCGVFSYIDQVRKRKIVGSEQEKNSDTTEGLKGS